MGRSASLTRQVRRPTRCGQARNDRHRRLEKFVKELTVSEIATTMSISRQTVFRYLHAEKAKAQSCPIPIASNEKQATIIAARLGFWLSIWRD